ncbi:hypothetical protein MycrhN_3076 [Mycolicibacterium rhodesiae NBB3]|uniref:Uncharacterized protein n=1 Tax=Mycolicibacterium rhodesiae (strain NBB3) TaxID=710685 RepID=G8RLI2_MYCRN|nr:hypothetical protein [Mycolicibacterium rhodesiae]AEV73614.1 hypothetical protein MycrhN_3076 [Mycolicibacterium rhodesiae NBB3]
MSEPRSIRPAPRGRADRACHQCPGRCGRSVPNHLYACERCWRRLPAQLQQAIRASVAWPVLSPARTRAFTAAAEFYNCGPGVGERAMCRR